MQEKKVLRVKKALSDNIIALATSATTYIDDDFYQNKFGEDKKNPNFKAYPVEITSLPIQWIISTTEGKDFL